jgi:hypothetical protein
MTRTASIAAIALLLSALAATAAKEAPATSAPVATPAPGVSASKAPAGAIGRPVVDGASGRVVRGGEPNDRRILRPGDGPGSDIRPAPREPRPFRRPGFRKGRSGALIPYPSSTTATPAPPASSAAPGR